MSVLNLEKIFSPRVIAVVCGFEQLCSTGMAVMHNLAAGGFTGRIYPVQSHCHGMIRTETYRTIRELPEPVDLAIIVSPINAVAEIVAECVGMGVGGAVVIPPGGIPPFELKGRTQEQVLETIAGSDFRVIWSDALGIISTREKLNAGLAKRMPKIGNTAFITQSGAIGEAILDFAAKENIGFSHFISLGTMLDVDFGDLVDFLGTDPHVNSIVIYMENLTRVRNFMSAARAVSRIKPIIALKAGRTAAGAAAAVSHTGALTSEDAVYDAAFKRSGIVRVKTFAELFDCVEFIGKQPGPKGHGLAIVTNAGGPGVMAVDALWDYGVSPALLAAETIGKLNGFLPPHWSRANPVDILDDATPERYAMTVDVLMNAREVDGLLIMLVPHPIAEPARTAHDLADLLKKQSIPVFMTWLGGSDADAGRAVFNQAGIPTLDSPERAVRAFMDLYHYSRNIETLQQIPKKLPDRLNFDRDTARRLINTGLERKNGLLTEIEAKQLLISYGIPVNIAEPAADAEHAVRIAENIGFPVAMKVLSTGYRS
jgi:acetyltransferase